LVCLDAAVADLVCLGQQIGEAEEAVAVGAVGWDEDSCPVFHFFEVLPSSLLDLLTLLLQAIFGFLGLSFPLLISRTLPSL